MKHLFLALLLMGMISLLAACGGSDDAGGDKPAAQAESAQTAPDQTAAEQTAAGEVEVSIDENASGAAVVMVACSKCHGLDKVCGKIGSLDKAGWAVVISKMVTKGAELNREQALGAAEFLAEPALAKPAVCN